MGIGFFAPLPLAMMLPFMAGQSMIMGESFGKGFQYGKRKISSMSNEQFNNMDANQLGRELLTDYTQIIPHLEQAVRASSDFQNMIIQELIKIIPNFVDQLLGGGSESGQGAPPPVQSPVGLGPPSGIPGFITPIIPGVGINQPPLTYPQIPTATAKFSANEQFAINAGIKPSTLDKNAGTIQWRSNITFKEVAFLLQLRADGKLFPTWQALGASILKKYNALKPVQKTPEQGSIEATTPGTIAAKISTWFSQIRSTLASSMLKTPNHRQYNQFIKELRAMISAFNRYVQSTRNPNTGKTFANLSIDTDKSIKARRIIPKT